MPIKTALLCNGHKVNCIKENAQKRRWVMYMDIAGRIKEFRREEKLTQARLAELLNVSRQTVGAWEQGVSLR